MDVPKGTFKFQRMSWMLTLRDLLVPPEEILSEVGIQPGFQILDYGCGTGSFTFEAAQRVGPQGKVYALDIHPRALEKIHKGALKKGLPNIETVLTSCITRVDPGSINVVLFYYLLHWLTDPDCILKELQRVMKSDGILSFRDPYMEEEEILSAVTEKGWFRLSGKGVRTYRFMAAGKEAMESQAFQGGGESPPI